MTVSARPGEVHLHLVLALAAAEDGVTERRQQDGHGLLEAPTSVGRPGIVDRRQAPIRQPHAVERRDGASKSRHVTPQVEFVKAPSGQRVSVVGRIGVAGGEPEDFREAADDLGVI